MAKIMLGYNFDMELAKYIVKMNAKYKDTTNVQVHDVYGSLKGDPIGCSRELSRLPDIEWDVFAEHVKYLKENGIAFNYVFNTASFGAIQDFEAKYDDMVAFLKKLRDVGVQIVTVTLPLVIEMINKEVPELKVNVSTITHVENVQQFLYYKDVLKVDRITLKLDSNRDFKFLEQIKDLGVDIELMTTEFCMWSCPWRDHHYDLQSHNSKFGPYGNYPYGRCISAIDTPGKWLMTRFVRPEDMALYEEMGIQFFKITGRTFPTSWLKNTLKVYYERKHNGNLMDICPMIMNIGHRKLPPQFIIPNDKLNGFLEYFRDSGVNCQTDCGVKCNFCNEFADKIGARKLTKEERLEYTSFYTEQEEE